MFVFEEVDFLAVFAAGEGDSSFVEREEASSVVWGLAILLQRVLTLSRASFP